MPYATTRGIMSKDLIEWFATQTFAQETRQNYKRNLSSIFRWAIAAGYRMDNPAAAVASFARSEQLPRILTPKQVAAIMEAAELEKIEFNKKKA